MLLCLLLQCAIASTALAQLRRAPADLYLETAGPGAYTERVYIVQLTDPPALSYRGRPGGPPATKPADGERFDVGSARVRQYARELMNSHDGLLQSVGAFDGKLYSYRYAFNGFAARLTEIQAQKLRSRKNVANVWEDQVRYLNTNNSANFLGLFSAVDGLSNVRGLTGENVVIGIIDSGIAPEHDSFKDTKDGDRPNICKSSWAENSLLGLWLCRRFKKRDDQLNFEPPADWNGICQSGENFSAISCNNKLIGARYYIDGFLEQFFLDDNEFVSPRDADGHGTHIASIAAGNEVRASIAGTDIARIRGMAPRARIAVYKACWLEPGQTRGSCSTSDLQRAIEDAVADGVDIINYSVGNSDIDISDPDDIALLAASNAGVLSVVAAGNDGPIDGTILSPSGAPWVLTVGASSRDGDRFQEAIRVNAPSNVATDYAAKEASFTPLLKDVGPLTEELVLVDDGVSVLGAGQSGTTFDACEEITNGDEVADKIAFIQRGRCDFEDKILNAQNAGAIAVVVFDTQGDGIIMAGTRDSVDIPAVMIGAADGDRLLTELQSGDAVEVTLDKTLFLQTVEDGDVMGSFSSRGPNLTAPDVLKPDVTAPGVNILGGQTPDVANGVRDENYQYLSGTSQSTPHVAGVAALLKEAHPDWTPAMLKSALMTTARQDVFKEDSVTSADAFDIGSGHVVPNSAADPGLVYDATASDYDAFTCKLEQPRVSQTECLQLEAAGFPTDPADLNLPSIAVSTLVSSRTVRRRVTNVGGASQYRVSVTAPNGIDVAVTPEVLSIDAGATADYEVQLTAAGAETFEWNFGSVTWDDGEHSVRSPIVARAIDFLAPLELRDSGTSGSIEFDVQFGYSGGYSTTLHGLKAPMISADSVDDDPLNSYVFNPDGQALPSSIRRFEGLEIPENTAYVRIALFNDETDGDDDLDLYVYDCTGLCTTVGISGNTDSDEMVDVLFPLAGQYIIDVHGFNTDDVGSGPGANFNLFAWVVGIDEDAGNMVLNGAPANATAGTNASLTLDWAVPELQRYLGGITHRDENEAIEFTLVEIDN